jgi:hypothetical protein
MTPQVPAQIAQMYPSSFFPFVSPDTQNQFKEKNGYVEV